MRIELRCEDLGFDCRHVLQGNSEEEVIEMLERHIDLEHDSDSFDHDEVYISARGNMHRVPS